MRTGSRPTRPFAVIAIAVTIGCGGSESPLTPTPSTPTPPFVPPTIAVNGLAYLRSDSTAWPAVVSSVTGIAQASVGLNTQTATTSSVGSFSLTIPLTSNRDAQPVTINAPGFMPAWSPWRLVDSSESVAVGLYREQSVAPRVAGFIKGITFQDGGAWAVDWFNAGLHVSSVARMRSAGGANLVSFADMLSVTQIDTIANTVTITNESGGLGTRAHYEAIVAQARANGMAFMMTLSVTPRGEAVPIQSVIYQVSRTKDALWNAYFAAYRARVLEKAVIARDLGIEYFGLGYNLGFLSRLDAGHWRDLVRDVRAIGYTGKLFYVATVLVPAGYHELTTVPPDFMSNFDLIGVTLTGGVIAARGETLANAQPRYRMRADLGTTIAQASGLIASSGKPYFIVAGFPSVFGAAALREFLEACVSCSPMSLSYSKDYMQQADLYQALAEAINTRSADAKLSGLVSWGYNWSDDFNRAGNFSAPGAAAFEKSGSVRDKPAEAVLKWWFQRW